MNHSQSEILVPLMAILKLWSKNQHPSQVWNFWFYIFKSELIRTMNGVTVDRFKSELDKFLCGVPDQPTLPGRGRAASTNSLLDQLQLIFWALIIFWLTVSFRLRKLHLFEDLLGRKASKRCNFRPRKSSKRSRDTISERVSILSLLRI